MKHGMDGTKQWIVIDLGAQTAFNTYTIRLYEFMLFNR